MGLRSAFANFQAHLRTLDTEEALVDLWVYCAHIMQGCPLPPEYAQGSSGQDLRHYLHAWDFEVLSREIVLNARRGPNSLKSFHTLATTINLMRKLEDAQSAHDGPATIWDQLHRSFHRQFSWQRELLYTLIVRTLKIYGAESMRSLIEGTLGIDLSRYLMLGMGVAGGFLRNPRVLTNNNYDALNIPSEVSAAMFKRVTADIGSLRKSLLSKPMADQAVYLANALENTPLINVDPDHPERAYCPVPRFFERRITSGIYYDVVAKPGFSDAFGKSFENYVGEVLRATCPLERFAIRPETPYMVGKELHHGIDWILSDPGGHICIEAKAKKLRQASKLLTDPQTLEDDLKAMGTAVAQHYRNIQEVLDGKTTWEHRGRPIHPIILTLDDWYLISPSIQERLRTEIDKRLAAYGLSLSLPEQMPFTIASIEEFETSVQVIAQLGIDRVMRLKSTEEHRTSALLPFIQVNFGGAVPTTRRLFQEDFDAWKNSAPWPDRAQ